MLPSPSACLSLFWSGVILTGEVSFRRLAPTGTKMHSRADPYRSGDAVLCALQMTYLSVLVPGNTGPMAADM